MGKKAKKKKHEEKINKNKIMQMLLSSYFQIPQMVPVIFWVVYTPSRFLGEDISFIPTHYAWPNEAIEPGGLLYPWVYYKRWEKNLSRQRG